MSYIQPLPSERERCAVDKTSSSAIAERPRCRFPSVTQLRFFLLHAALLWPTVYTPEANKGLAGCPHGGLKVPKACRYYGCDVHAEARSQDLQTPSLHRVCGLITFARVTRSTSPRGCNLSTRESCADIRELKSWTFKCHSHINQFCHH